MSEMSEAERQKGIAAILDAHAGLLRAHAQQPSLQKDGHMLDTSPEWQAWYADVYGPAADAWTEAANRAGALGYPSISLNPTNVVAWCLRQIPVAIA
jgi:hypothetical protein